MKEFDVHFKISFHDMLTGIEAETKLEAADKASEMLPYSLADRIIYILKHYENDYNIEVTEVLEV